MSKMIAERFRRMREASAWTRTGLQTCTNNATKNVIPYVIFGMISVVFGISIYIFLPLGLLSQNFGMVLAVFLSLLMGMMLGLTLFVTNL